MKSKEVGGDSMVEDGRGRSGGSKRKMEKQAQKREERREKFRINNKVGSS